LSVFYAVDHALNPIDALDAADLPKPGSEYKEFPFVVISSSARPTPDGPSDYEVSVNYRRIEKGPPPPSKMLRAPLPSES